jgi:hypothetical protein
LNASCFTFGSINLEGRPERRNADLSIAAEEGREKRLEAENAKLKAALADKTLENDFFRSALLSDTQSRNSRRISGLLAAAEVGLAFAALVTLGLFLRSLSGLENTPAGFDHRNVTVSRLFLAANDYAPTEEQQFSLRLRERLLAAPGVMGAAYSDSIPLGFGLGKWNEV